MKDFFEIRKIISILSWTTILLSFILIVYALQYNVLIDHDYVMSYGYSFMHPEHGRYLSTFMINFLIERVPYFFNIHPNIIEKLVIAPIKAVIIILFCLFFANAFFLAKKGKKNPLSFEFSNIVFIITYVIIFLSLFNCNYFFINEWSYFMTQQTTKFFDYPFNLLWWVILFNFLSFYIINPNLLLKKSDTKMWVLILIFTFIVGISIEPINAPVAFVFFIMFFYFLFNLSKYNKTGKVKMLSLFFVYILALVCYYIKPNDESLNISPYNSYMDYVFNDFYNYCSVYIHSDFFKNMSFFSIVILFFLIAIYIKTKNKNFIFFVLLNLFSIFLFYFAIFLLGRSGDSGYYVTAYGEWIWMFLYKLMALFFLILTIGYFIDRCIENNKKNTIKFILCILTLIIFSKYLIVEYKSTLTDWIYEQKIERIRSYIVEKVAITYPDTENIVLPEKYKDIEMSSWMLRIGRNDNSFISYLQILHYPELQNKKEIIIDKNYQFDDNLFTDDELEDLNFQKLLTHRIHKNKIISR